MAYRSITGSIQISRLPGRFANVHDVTSGTWPDQLGSGDSTVRAHFQAMGVSLSPSGPVASGYRCPMRRWASSLIHRPYACTSAAKPCARSQVVRVLSMSGCTGGSPLKRGGTSIVALLISTATGFKSPASAVSPSRWASSGMAPPPAKGSKIGGGPSGKHRSISARASASMSGLLEFSHLTSRSKIPNSRLRSASCSSGVNDRSPEGSSTSEAQITARLDASGLRDHQRCSVEGCPCRIDFSRAASRLITANGNATSINFGFNAVTRTR